MLSSPDALPYRLCLVGYDTLGKVLGRVRNTRRCCRFVGQWGGEVLSYAASSVGDRGAWAQAVGTMRVAGNKGGLHGTDVRMTTCVRCG